MKSRLKKKAIPFIATTILATTALSTQILFNEGSNQKAEAQSFSKEEVKKKDATWLAGDHHIHSEWSVGWDNSTTPPTQSMLGMLFIQQ
jgi:hypothetical protein